MSDTKTQLLDAAELQVRRKGADGFSYADLSAAVGIRKASIHYHFPAKSDLLTALMTRYSKSVQDALEGFSKDLPTAGARLNAFLDVYRAALEDGTSLCLCVAYAVSQEGFEEDTRAEILAFRDAVRAWLGAAFKDAVADGSVADVSDPAEEATGAMALAEGAQIAARIAGDVALFDQASAALRTRITS